MEIVQLTIPSEIKKIKKTETGSSTSFLDIYLKYDTNGQLSVRAYDKRDDFKFNSYVENICITASFH